MADSPSGNPVSGANGVELHALLERVLTSPEFEGADRMCDLLRHLVQSVLAGRADELKESTIGVEVFGRVPGYDSKLDPVVRVSVGRLRQRLQRYYEQSGRQDHLRIDIPKGGYLPRIITVEQPTPELPVDTAPPEQSPAAAPPANAAPPVRRTRWLAVAILVIAGGALAAWYLAHQPRTPPVAELILASRPFTTVQGNVAHGSFSPDGQTVAFDWESPTDEARHIWLQRIGSATPVRFTGGPLPEIWPVWSPDGNWIAFLRRAPDGISQIVVRPVVGFEERVLARVPTFDHDRPRLDWSPDGTTLVVPRRTVHGSPSGLLLVDARTGATRPLTDPPSGIDGDAEAVFSPDSATVAFRRTFSTGIEDVFVVPARGGQPRQITNDRRGIGSLAWRSDGRALIVPSRRSGSVLQMWEFPLSGGLPTRLTPAGLDSGAPALSRDGRSLLFMQSQEDKNIYSLTLGSPEPPRRLIWSVAQDTNPTVSPDGRTIAFRSNRTGADEIWLADADGRNERQLTHMDGPETGSPRWSPDGTELLFNSRPLGQADVYVIAATGGSPRPLTPPDSHEFSPSWSPDGRTVYYSSNRGGTQEVWRQPLTGGPAEQLTTGTASSPRVAPDGRTLYYSRSLNGGGLFALDLTGPLPREGQRIAPLNNRLLGHWTIAASGIYFVDLDGPATAVLKHYSFATKVITQRASLPGHPSFYDGGLAISADERTVYYSRLDRAGSHLMLGRQR